MSHKKGHRIAHEVKADILRRIKEGGVSVAQAAQEHGIHETTIYDWLAEGAEGAPTLGELVRLKKENQDSSVSSASSLCSSPPVKKER